ncbi:hypothetical protein TrLO_g8758 [Triparma laevis f. longispina]|uniref:Derlin n=1 Tax=Triparma laevis f. longispina TaxID=1714387 RepID=A0A9W7C4Y7_9STRA|nr:hypothetical protein TrLO_g8758 [Triparma laevis f. longispina]
MRQGNIHTANETNPVKAWFDALPPLTRLWFTAALLNACFVYFGTISAQSIAWSWELVFSKFHIWRPVTCFWFVGTFGREGFNTLISLYMLQQYSGRYERQAINTGGGGTLPDYITMLAIVGVIQLAVGTLWLGAYFYGTSMYFAVMYVWCKSNPTTDVSIWGFRLKAGIFPFVLMALHMATGGDWMGDALGIGSGHCYFFLVDVYPSMQGKDLIHTPNFLITWCHRLTGGGNAYVPPTATNARNNNFGARGAAGGGGGGMAAPGRVNAPNANPGGGYNWGGGGRALGAN